MNTLSIQNGGSEINVPGIAFVQQQIEWLSDIIDTRLKLYFGHDCAFTSIEQIKNADVQNSSGICFSWDDVSLFDVTSGRNIGYIEKGEVFTDAMGS